MTMLPIDYVGPRKRPPGPNAGTQQWRDLLFVHVAVDPALLRPLVPAPLELDLWEGKALLGFVPFRMERIVPPLIPSIFGLNFLETNLRTYVRMARPDSRAKANVAKPGVFFLSLEASSIIAVEAAKAFWGLPYFHANMSIREDEEERTYASERRGSEGRFFAKARFGGPLLAPEPPALVPGSDASAPRFETPSLEYFLLERYLLFVARGDAIHCGAVHHRPYPVRAVELLEFRETLSKAAGIPEVSAPICAHASPGVSVEVFSTFPVAKIQPLL